MINDVHVTVARELDRKVLNLEQDLAGFNRGKAVGALLFNSAQLVNAFLQSLCLLSVSKARVEE